MKPLLRLVTGACLALAPALASAQQGHTIVFGRTTVNFAGSFQQTLASLGATITDLNALPLTNGIAYFEGTEGVIDLQTGIGELNTKGGYIVSAFGVGIKIQNLAVDLSNPAAPVITGIFVVNGKVLPRQQVFLLSLPPSLALPLTPTNDTEVLTGFGAILAPAAAATINGVFGAQVLQPSSTVGTVDLFAVLAATNGSL